MANWNRFVIAISLFVVSLSAHAGENRYIVHFTDKDNTPYSIDRPEEFLSFQSVERRARQNIDLTELDLPVDPSYLDSLNTIAKVWYSSRWFNAALVEMNASQAEEVALFDFVSSVELVAPPEEISRGRIKKTGKTKRLEKENTSTNTSQQNTNQNLMLGIDYMHDAGFKGEGMTIAVFDAGFPAVDNSSFFQYLRDRDGIVATYSFVHNEDFVYDYSSHGTRVLSTISAFKENEYIGGAYNADVVLCVTEDQQSEYRIEEYNWLFAAEYADSIGVDIINSSLGYTTFDDPAMNYTQEDLTGDKAVVSKAASMAAATGILVVSSAGNEGNKPWLYITPPADGHDVFSIGSVKLDGTRSSFSSIGPTYDGRGKPDVCALGTFVSVVRGDQVVTSDGTSFSAPQIAALAAGVWQAFPDYTAEQVMQAIRNSGNRSANPDMLQGYGVPSFTLLYLTLSTPEFFEPNFVVYPNPVDGNSIFILSKESDFTGSISLEFYSYEGKIVKREFLSNHLLGQPLTVDITDLQPGKYILISKSKSLTNVSRIVVL